MNKTLIYKLLALAAMALILIFALGRIEWKVQERQATRDSAVAGIASQYAEAQQIAGPLLWLQCSESQSVTRFDEKNQPRVEQEQLDCSRFIRPESVTGVGSLDVSERYRGIYKARVYLANLRIKAQFDPVKFKLQPRQTLQAAYWVFNVSDPRGLKRIDVRDGQNKPMDVQPGTVDSPLGGGFHIPQPLESLDQPHTLTVDIQLAGSGRMDWVPVGASNDFRLTSAWPHPAFSGNYLPETREIGAAGFTAHWRINDFATGGDAVLAQGPANAVEGGSEYAQNGQTPRTGFQHAFGVSLIDPVDAYVQSDRAVRYGFLFILLTLGGFFLFELLKRQAIHPLQYLLTGFAVVVFFLLLLALSEHTGFVIAYLIAAAVCTALIATYGRTLLGSWKASAVLGVGYAGLFAGLYQLLASEDHALLMGAWLTFIVLAATMYLTRKLDWRDAGRAPRAQAEVE